MTDETPGPENDLPEDGSPETPVAVRHGRIEQVDLQLEM